MRTPPPRVDHRGAGSPPANALCPQKQGEQLRWSRRGLPHLGEGSLDAGRAPTGGPPFGCPDRALRGRDAWARAAGATLLDGQARPPHPPGEVCTGLRLHGGPAWGP